jgi:hypothetical protein
MGTFRKQLLPFSTVTYKGRKVTFDREYAQALIDAFRRRAYDAVKLVMATKDNEHTADPERVRRQGRTGSTRHQTVKDIADAAGARRAADAARPAKEPENDGLTPEMAARASRVEAGVSSAQGKYDTETLHKTGPGGTWSEERQALHRQIVDDLYARNAHVPKDGKAIISGGLGGAGKGTVLEEHAGIDKNQYLTLNPDDVKEEMARRGMVPDIPGHKGLSPMERSSLIHEESGDIAKMLAERAYAERRNVIWDITMSSPKSVKDQIAAMKDEGYEVSAVFVDIPVSVSVRRALARWDRGHREWLAGKGQGGRYVPPAIIRKQQSPRGNLAINREVFEELKPLFDDWGMWDNSVDGRDAIKAASKGGTR